MITPRLYLRDGICSSKNLVELLHRSLSHPLLALELLHQLFSTSIVVPLTVVELRVELLYELPLLLARLLDPAELFD